MTRARTLADMISDGVIGTTELANDAITPVKLDETGSYAMAGLTVDTDTLHIDSANNRVGIGTTSPASQAHIYNAAASANLRIETDADAYASISFLNDQSNWGTGVDTANHFYVYDSINSSNVMEFGNNDIVFNQTGKDYDFRVESDGNTHMLFVDASENAVAIGSASTSTAARLRAAASAVASGDSIVLIDSANDANVAGNHLHITSLRGDTSAYNLLTIDNVAGEILNISGNGSVVFNEAGGDRDFRIESDLTNYSFFVDASSSSGYGHVKISGNTPASGTSTAGGDSTTYTNGLTIENNEASYTNGALALVNKYNWGYGNSIEWHNVYDTSGGTLGITNRITSQWVSANNYKTDFFEMSGGVLRKSLSLNAGQVVVNEDGQDEDFRVESDANANMIFVDSSANKVGIGTSTPGGELTVSGTSRFEKGGTGTALVATGSGSNMHLNTDGSAYFIFQNTAASDLYAVFKGSTYEAFRFGAGNATFNESGRDYDFRVESDGATHMLYVDAGNDCTNIASTQTEAMFGGGFPSSGYVKNFYKSEAVKTAEFGAGSSTPSRTITIVINMNAYRGACVKVNTSGHLWNNGSAFFNRVNEFYLASEGSASRINSRVDILAAGSQIGNIGVPTATLSGTNQYSITQTVGAGYTANVFVEVTGMGYSSMGSISIA